MGIYTFLTLISVLPSVVPFWGEECDVIPPDGCSCYQYTDVPFIDCSRLELTEIPSFQGINDVIDLDLSWNNISGLVRLHTFNEDVRIRELTLAHNYQGVVIAFSEDMFSNGQELELRALTLAYGGLSQPPACIRHLANLRSLDLSHNQIEYLDIDQFAGLFKLEMLDLTGNQIWEVTNDLVFDIPSLDILRITFEEYPGNVYVNVIPKRLHELTFEDTSLRNLRFLRKFHSLDTLKMQNCDLSDNDLTKRDNYLGNSKRTLISLDLSMNQLTSYPIEFVQYCKKLEYLDLSHNEIDFLHATYGLTYAPDKVTYLNLAHNFITDLPNSFIEMFPRLSHLDISENRLLTIYVDFISDLPHLQYLNVAGNELHSIMVRSQINSMVYPDGLSIYFGNNVMVCDCDMDWFSGEILNQIETGSGPWNWHDVYNVQCSLLMTTLPIYRAFNEYDNYVNCGID